MSGIGAPPTGVLAWQVWHRLATILPTSHGRTAPPPPPGASGAGAQPAPAVEAGPAGWAALVPPAPDAGFPFAPGLAVPAPAADGGRLAPLPAAAGSCAAGIE